MAKGSITAERKNRTHPQAMLHRTALNWRFLWHESRRVEGEPVTAVCNVRIDQRQSYIQVIMRAVERPSRFYSFLYIQVVMRAVERPSRFYSFLKEIESMNMSFCNQQLISTSQKINYKNIFSATIA